MSGAGDRITNGWSAPAIERVCVRSSTVPRRVVVRIILMVRIILIAELFCPPQRGVPVINTAQHTTTRRC